MRQQAQTRNPVVVKRDYHLEIPGSMLRIAPE
jgi:hypothetical protein